MTGPELTKDIGGALVFGGPAALAVLLGVSSLVNRRLSEAATARAVGAATTLALVGAVGILVVMLTGDSRHVVIGPWYWVTVGGHDDGYHFVIKLVFDRLSVPFIILTLLLCSVVGSFAGRYMHREPGFNRFFTLYAIFLLGMLVAAAAGTIETLFAGWELVGLSSALLVGFFQERPAPVRNGLRVWVVYRVADAALLMAAVALHHLAGDGDIDLMTGYHGATGASPSDVPSWPFGLCDLSSRNALLVGALVLVAAAGKSALLPFSGWLPRAMEGPTPSSAIFYGALSVHLGAYLLLRISPVLDAAPVLSAAVCLLGLATAGYGALVGRVQTDIKSALSFASLTQVGLIVAETGAGWRYIPLVHLIGHACLRTLQFVRAPSYLQDRKILENAAGGPLSAETTNGPATGGWLYRFALERGYLDAILTDFVAVPFRRWFQWFDRLDRRAAAALGGSPAANAPPPPT